LKLKSVTLNQCVKKKQQTCVEYYILANSLMR
jgi:hypothetical protein